MISHSVEQTVFPDREQSSPRGQARDKRTTFSSKRNGKRV
jgi:hypothetical protein